MSQDFFDIETLSDNSLHFASLRTYVQWSLHFSFEKLLRGP